MPAAAIARRFDSGVQVGLAYRRQRGKAAVEQADIDLLAPARPLALDNSSKNADGRIVSAQFVDRVDTSLQRTAVCLSRDRHDSGFGLKYGIEARLGPARPLLSITRHRTID